MTIDELIAALEAETGPSRELDIEIAVAADRAYETHLLKYTDGTYQRCAWRPNGFGGVIPTPSYTASLDAALTLVPEDACWTITVPRQPDMSGKRYWASIRSGHSGARGSTPAIALCIAALKARRDAA